MMRVNILTTPKYAQTFAQLLMLIAILFLITNCIQMRTLNFDTTIRSLGRNGNAGDSLDGSHTSMEMSSHVSLTTQDISPAVEKNSQRINYYNEIPKRKPIVQTDLVQAGDYIYYHDVNSWDAAPIVIESHKLLFFTIPKVGCTVWKQLFRRMMNYTDWTSQDYDTYQPHNPEVNGLKYLYNYSLEEASIMMTSPEWTRAMMVRDPKQRFLSAFLDKAVGNFHNHIRDRCCHEDEKCVENAQTIVGFLTLCSKCYDDHWRPQSTRIDHKYWPYMDQILHVETAANDTRRLLQTIGAWEEYGMDGWGENGEHSIFASKGSNGAGMNHSTYAEYQVWKWYSPESERLVERFYQGDYENPLFRFDRGDCLTCIG
jgi:Sulfotransferase family